MKIETIVAELQKTTTDRDAEPHLRALMDRLDGMCPNTATARWVAEKVGLSWEEDLGSPGSSSLLAWARLVRRLHDYGYIDTLVPAVLPFLPEGQPYTEGELFSVDADLAAAMFEGSRGAAAAEAARKRKAEMVGWNMLVAKSGAAPTPEPMTALDVALAEPDKPRRPRRSKGKGQTGGEASGT